MTLVLALKLLLAPCLVVASSLAGRRWDPRAAGMLIVLPIVAGPILLIVYLEHGAAFAGRAAPAATLGVVPLAVYAVVFALATRRFGWATSLLLSWLSVVVADLVLVWVDLPAVIGLVLAVLALSGANWLLRRMKVSPQPRPVPPWWDLLARGAATAALVLLVTGLADVLGLRRVFRVGRASARMWPWPPSRLQHRSGTSGSVSPVVDIGRPSSIWARWSG